MRLQRSTLSYPVRVHCHYERGVPNSRCSHTVAVLAFKTVYTLETKRRGNDKRVLALYVEYVVLDLDRVPSSYKSQDERHDGSSCAVRFMLFISF